MTAEAAAAAQPDRAAQTDHAGSLLARHFAAPHGELHVGGLAIRKIVREFGSPLFVYDGGVLRSQLASVRTALPARCDLYYSMKANPSLRIVEFYAHSGVGIEVASGGELQVALRAGCPPERILFAGPGKSDQELTLALEHGIREIHVESFNEITRLAALAERMGKSAAIALRFNPTGEAQGGAMRMGGKPSPFGFAEELLDQAVQHAAQYKMLRTTGVHIYAGTQILDHDVLLRQYRKAIEIARRVAQQLGHPLHTIDLGGGLGVPYFAHESPLDLAALGDGLRRIAEELQSDRWLSDSRLVIEPGRYLVAEAGIYAATVVDVKDCRGHRFVVLDGGLHHHLAASGNLGQTIKRNYPIKVLNRLSEPPQQTADIVGCLCTPLDTLGRQVALPTVEPGDLVGIFASGAYARSASPLGFLSHATPAEVWVEAGTAQLIRRRGGYDDMLRDQYSSVLQETAPGPGK